MEIETKVETYRIDMKCEKCKVGLMHCTGKGITQMDTTWEHICESCGENLWYRKSYPCIEHRDKRKNVF